MMSSAPRLFVVAVILIVVSKAYPCAWVNGYFYEVTQLRGKVVGARLGPLQYSRRLRQSFIRKKAKLSLYEYRWPIQAGDLIPLVKSTKTDDRGRFDFGTLSPGHYTLTIDDAERGSSDRFDVEITSMSSDTKSVTVDISPSFPDCKGGHEFVVK